MPYCPRCGREQKCGCLECHLCGVPLVDEAPAVNVAPVPANSPPGPQAARRSRGEPDAGRLERDVRSTPAPVTVLAIILLLAGCAILVLTVIESARQATWFTGTEMASSAKRLGYYLGSLIYNGSVRFVTGYVLLALGLLLHPPAPFRARESWRRAVRLTAGLMGFTGFCSLIAIILLAIPGGSVGPYSRALLPPLAAAIPALIALTVFLVACAYLTATSASGSREGAAADSPPGSSIVFERGRSA